MTTERFEPIDLDGLDAKAETLERSERRYVLSKRVVDNLAPFLLGRSNNRSDDEAVQMAGTTIAMSGPSVDADLVNIDSSRPKTVLARFTSFLGGRE